MAKKIVDLTPPHPAFQSQAGKTDKRRKGENNALFRQQYEQIDWTKEPSTTPQE